MTLAFGTTSGITGGGYFWEGENKRIGKAGYPGERTVPEQGIICYIGQEGNNEIQSIMTSSSFLIEQGKILLSTLHGAADQIIRRKAFSQKKVFMESCSKLPPLPM